MVQPEREYAAAAAITLFWGNLVSQSDFISEIPQHPNPHKGFRGKHPEPLSTRPSRRLRHLCRAPACRCSKSGYKAAAVYGTEQLKSEIDQGHPVGVANQRQVHPTAGIPGNPMEKSTKLVLEHAIVVYGYDGEGIYLMDVGTGEYVHTEWESFLMRWNYFWGMMLLIRLQDRLLGPAAGEFQTRPIHIKLRKESQYQASRMHEGGWNRRGGSPCPPCVVTTHVPVDTRAGHGDPPLRRICLLLAALARCQWGGFQIRPYAPLTVLSGPFRKEHPGMCVPARKTFRHLYERVSRRGTRERAAAGTRQALRLRAAGCTWCLPLVPAGGCGEIGGSDAPVDQRSTSTPVLLSRKPP